MTDKINHINNYFNTCGNLIDLKDKKKGDVRSTLLLLALDHGDTC